LRKRCSIASITASGTPWPPPDPLTSTFASDETSRAASDALMNFMERASLEAPDRARH
jgi:hypothetical protein